MKLEEEVLENLAGYLQSLQITIDELDPTPH
jgi:hypothetical protein